MNAFGTEQKVISLSSKTFDSLNFPYNFLETFGIERSIIKSLRLGDTNKSDMGGVLLKNQIHIAVCNLGQVKETFEELKESSATSKFHAKYILATDGFTLKAENLHLDEKISCDFCELPFYVWFFLSIADSPIVKNVTGNAFDMNAIRLLSQLYFDLIKINPEWGVQKSREDMNYLMMRLIFCFFAEDTGILGIKSFFTSTIKEMTDKDASSTNEIITKIFRAMNTPKEQRFKLNLPKWLDLVPYAYGNLFAENIKVPEFNKSARASLLNVGNLDWKQINPDVFGIMIQLIAGDEERSSLGMHYTSVPNILKVIRPLFIDDLLQQLKEAGTNHQKLLNLKNKLAKIRIFDPACGSGNFLITSYKEIRLIENQINRRLNVVAGKTLIPLTNFRGIEIRSFSSEIARLALIIAKYQCDVLYFGKIQALDDFFTLNTSNWIVCGNALIFDWVTICPPLGTDFQDSVEINHDFNSKDVGDVYICGNPPYKGSKWQTKGQKSALANAWLNHPNLAKTTDLASGWIAKYLQFSQKVTKVTAAFVTTSSLCQGQQASEIWPVIYKYGQEITFAYKPFVWSNSAANNAGVTVIIVGLGKKSSASKTLFEKDQRRICSAIGPYLVPDSTDVVVKSNVPLGQHGRMFFGNMPRDGGHLVLSPDEVTEISKDIKACSFVRPFVGASELINGRKRYCLWIDYKNVDQAMRHPLISEKLRLVAKSRRDSKAKSTRDFADRPYRFVQIGGVAKENVILVAGVSSKKREYLPADYFSDNSISSNKCFALYDAPLWNFSLVVSRLHMIWISTVCVRMRSDFSYSNTLGWNTFPIPKLTEANKDDLTRSAEKILLVRRSFAPRTLGDLYDPQRMPSRLRDAHEYNDETVENIFIGRRFQSNSERLEKLFELYKNIITASKESIRGDRFYKNRTT